MRGLAVGAGAWILVFAIAWWSIVPLPAAAYALFSVGFGLATLLPFVLDRLLVAGGRSFTTTFVLPTAAVVVDYLIACTSPYGSYGSLAYGQVTSLHLAQLAALGGWLGITFALTWVAAVVNWAWERELDAQGLRGLLATTTVFAILLLGASVRVDGRLSSASTVRAAGVVHSLPRDPSDLTSGDAATRAASLAETRKLAAEAQDALLAALEREAQAGARVLTTSEGAGFVLADDEAVFVARLGALARRQHAYLFPGLYVVTPGRSLVENVVLAIDPSGRERWRVHKHGLANGRYAGEPLRTLDTPYGHLGVVVDFDMASPTLVRQFGKRRADIVLVPSADPPAFDPLATRVAMLRAIENGFALICPLAHGQSVATDGRGRVLAAVHSLADSGQALVVAAPTRGARTLAPWTLAVLPWVCLGSLAALAASRLRSR